ncbi:MAG TPA: hypothetical protein VM370_04825 [Candidatus Thermoplasmatota archaeon]|nr:hypothetical protein [Candidatus Thermoplasmatota archaeon]
MRHLVFWLVLTLLVAGCMGWDPGCKRGSGPTDCSYHFSGVVATADFASRWNATRVHDAMRAAGWTDAARSQDNASVTAGPEAFHRPSLEARSAMDGASWTWSVSYDEGFAKRSTNADAQAKANESIARHEADALGALAKLEASLGESHQALRWMPIVAIE